MLSAGDWAALWLTLELALVSATLLLLISLPLAWWLSRGQSRLRSIVQVIVALPLVLPPTVLGFYLLLSLSEVGMAFSFTGLVVGSVLYSLPFVVQPLHDRFASLDQSLLDAAASLRAGPWDRFISIVLPQSRISLITAAALGFAHTLGEFGVVLMIGGNIPGETRVLSIAIYEHVETMNYGQAHALSLILILMAAVILACLYSLQGRRSNQTGFHTKQA
ncbi:MAG: molybdate ABC transporter permease subunit [Salinisphaeraceae bacterium]|nr:molybdate ABC transporter permease subunit [Salinisphaeraceae bacterium]